MYENLKVSPKNLAPEMHLPQIVADVKCRRKIAEKFLAQICVHSISEFGGKKMT
jgi:hypothetical protein